MSTFYSIDRANACLAEVSPLLEQLRARRDELVALRDRLVVAQRGGTAAPGAQSSASDLAPGTGSIDPDSPRMLEARVRAVIDQMEAGVGRLVELGVQLREIERGLIDFPALVNGRPVWLCWELGEGEEVHFWHEMNAGYAARRPLIELS